MSLCSDMYFIAGRFDLINNKYIVQTQGYKCKQVGKMNLLEDVPSNHLFCIYN